MATQGAAAACEVLVAAGLVARGRDEPTTLADAAYSITCETPYIATVHVKAYTCRCPRAILQEAAADCSQQHLRRSS
jgi:hypothetical protein